MPVSPVDLNNTNILITGPTGQVAAPIVDALSKIANVTALARFSKDSDKAALESRGIKVIRADLADKSSLQACPDEFDYVLNLAVVKSGNFAYDLAANGEGVGYLMARCKSAKAFCTSRPPRYMNTRVTLRAKNQIH